MRAALVSDDNIIANIIRIDSLSDIAGARFMSDKSKLKIGDSYDETLAHCEESPPLSNQQLPTITLSNVSVGSTNARLIGKIWWVPQYEQFTITAQAEGLPNGGLMVMVERVINASTPVDDVRFQALIKDGQVTMTGKFELSGNYIITANRLNAGLERIGAPFRLSFETMEFDAYVPAT
ncbi:hypothetical protein [Pseudoalteromonas sp. S16_S37]|uniref:hypothetical protein n=1 Tax=Pseudoalteromonas sp. S16_S37 TaxID=2720228 RepID=UPI001680E7B7|nr:hypothetical protein [Pseudoalteromonas sp. S16_S37]MBD1582806.1 DUF4369 domain-containing protein [Pseudoalteromonas sp. S16_S37]